MDRASYLQTPDEVFRRMDKFSAYYKNGGITLSGGEPLLQPEFAYELFRICRANGIHTAIDTAGATLSEEIKEVLHYTDLVLLDIKCIDAEIHETLTGKPLKPTLEFANYLCEHEIPTWIRYVLVPGITDQDELIERHADFVAGLKNVEKVEVLPFHKLGLVKYEKLGIPYPLKDVDVPTNDQIEHAKGIYRRKGLKVN